MKLWVIRAKEHGEGGVLAKRELQFQHTYLKHDDLEQKFLDAGSQTSCFNITWEACSKCRNSNS